MVPSNQLGSQPMYSPSNEVEWPSQWVIGLPIWQEGSVDRNFGFWGLNDFGTSSIFNWNIQNLMQSFRVVSSPQKLCNTLVCITFVVQVFLIGILGGWTPELGLILTPNSCYHRQINLVLVWNYDMFSQENAVKSVGFIVIMYTNTCFFFVMFYKKVGKERCTCSCTEWSNAALLLLVELYYIYVVFTHVYNIYTWWTPTSRTIR